MIFIELIFNDKIFKPYDNNYYVSNDGDIYSVYKKGLLKHNIDIYGYHRVDILGKQITFPSVKDFIIYSGHGNKSGSLNKCASKKWFKERYEIIERKSVETIESYNTLINDYKY